MVKVMDSSRGVKDSNLLAGIKWSVNHRADVINLSLGAPGRPSVFEATIDKAHANGKGAVGMTAAGNEGTPRKQYPAAYPAAIAVSATNNNDKLASFSSRGDWVDLAAPGTSILSNRAAIAGGGYGRESGTSESVPFVSAHAGCSPPKARRPAGSTNACRIPPPTWGPPASAHTTGTAGSTLTGPCLKRFAGEGGSRTAPADRLDFWG